MNKTLTQDQVVTLDALREAAEKYLATWKPMEGATSFHTASAWNRYNGLGAEFWRLAYQWRTRIESEAKSVSSFPAPLRRAWSKEVQEGEALIAEVEART